MNLDQFMNQDRVRDVYVSESGWLTLYVRKGHFRVLRGEKRQLILDLANIEATVKGKGTFIDLLVRIRKKYPEWVIFIECVINPRFGFTLEHLGFTRIIGEGFPNFYLLPEDKLL